jgi:hypothetical protein
VQTIGGLIDGLLSVIASSCQQLLLVAVRSMRAACE